MCSNHFKRLRRYLQMWWRTPIEWKELYSHRKSNYLLITIFFLAVVCFAIAETLQHPFEISFLWYLIFVIITLLIYWFKTKIRIFCPQLARLYADEEAREYGIAWRGQGHTSNDDFQNQIPEPVVAFHDAGVGMPGSSSHLGPFIEVKKVQEPPPQRDRAAEYQVFIDNTKSSLPQARNQDLSYLFYPQGQPSTDTLANESCLGRLRGREGESRVHATFDQNENVLPSTSTQETSIICAASTSKSTHKSVNVPPVTTQPQRYATKSSRERSERKYPNDDPSEKTEKIESDKTSEKAAGNVSLESYTKTKSSDSSQFIVSGRSPSSSSVGKVYDSPSYRSPVFVEKSVAVKDSPAIKQTSSEEIKIHSKSSSNIEVLKREFPCGEEKSRGVHGSCLARQTPKTSISRTSLYESAMASQMKRVTSFDQKVLESEKKTSIRPKESSSFSSLSELPSLHDTQSTTKKSEKFTKKD